MVTDCTGFLWQVQYISHVPGAAKISEKEEYIFSNFMLIVIENEYYSRLLLLLLLVAPKNLSENKNHCIIT